MTNEIEAALLEELQDLRRRVEALEAQARPPKPKVVKYAEAQAALGVSRTTLYRMVRNGEIRQLPGEGRPRFHREYLEAVRGGMPEGEAWARYCRGGLLTGKNK